jgi:hypothetical protein
MKSLLSLMAVVAGLFVLERCFISAETFTEGVRVSPETVILKPGQYVWEPERAPLLGDAGHDRSVDPTTQSPSQLPDFGCAKDKPKKS